MKNAEHFLLKFVLKLQISSKILPILNFFESDWLDFLSKRKNNLTD